MDVTAQRSPLQSLNFAALRIKDAICDQLREHTGERPSVDTSRPDLPVVLHVGPERAALYVTPRASRSSSAAGASTRATPR